MRLIFVYNADSGLFNALRDGVQKLLSPDDYPCELCALTYGIAAERRAWRRYREQSDIEMLFYHRDEFEQLYEQRFVYPIILQEEGEGLRPLLTRAMLQEIHSVEELIATLNTLVKEGPAPSC